MLGGAVIREPVSGVCGIGVGWADLAVLLVVADEVP